MLQRCAHSDPSDAGWLGESLGPGFFIHKMGSEGSFITEERGRTFLAEVTRHTEPWRVAVGASCGRTPPYTHHIQEGQLDHLQSRALASPFFEVRPHKARPLGLEGTSNTHLVFQRPR